MDESLNQFLLKVIDDHLIVDQNDQVKINKSSLFTAIQSEFPDFKAAELEKNLKTLEIDLTTEIMANISDDESLSKDDLLAQYQIIEPLAKGGMGEVYLAKRADGLYEKQVALKILSKGLITDETLKRFQREQQILADLKHPNIVPILDAGVSKNNRPWFVLEFIEGLRIDHYCDQNESKIKTISELAIQVCLAIEHAHKHGIIHRDLKPANILVETDGIEPKAMVLDFGIATHQQSPNMTSSGQIMGTPGYMSPEQTSGNFKDIDARSDVFSLGVILYKLFCGEHPYMADSVTETNFNILKNEPSFTDQKSPPTQLLAVIRKCLQKDPDSRYLSIKDLRDDLTRFMTGQPVLARKVSFWQRIGYKLKKQQSMNHTVLIFVTLTIITIVLMIVQSDQAKLKQSQMQEYIVTSKELEQKLREQQMLPLHDISPVYEDINHEINRLTNALSQSEPDDQGYIHATIAKSYKLLGQYPQAISAFNEAELHLFENDDMQLHYALALAQSWEQKNKQLTQIPDKKTREEKRKQHIENLLKPAQKKLSAVVSINPQSLYLHAYLAFLNHQFENAVALAMDATIENPGLFEAFRLAGKIEFLRGKESAINGDARAAKAAYQNAKNHLKQSTLVGRSDPESHQVLCDLLTTELHATIIGNSEVKHDFYQNALTACQQAEMILPGQFDVALSLTEIYAHIAAWNAELGVFDANDVNNYLRSAEKTHQLKPKNTEALSQMVMALIRISGDENDTISNDDKNVYLNKAQELAEKSIEINDQDAYNWANLADIHFTIAGRNLHNFDITEHVNEGLFAYQQSHDLLPSYAWLYNMARLTRLHGDYYRLKNSHNSAITAYESAIRYFQQTVDAAKDFSTAWLKLASAYISLINRKKFADQSYERESREAEIALNRACQLYQQKGGFTQELNKTIKDFQTVSEKPKSCIE